MDEVTKSRVGGRIISHILFWIISMLLFTVLIFYNRDFRFSEFDLRMGISILSTLFLLAISVYINLLWILPKFFSTRKYLLFFVLQLLNALLFILLNFILTGILEGYHPNFLEEAVAEFFLVIVFLAVSTLMKFMQDSINLQGVQLKIKEVERQKIESELRALKAQVNPHFFFNTLNSMYALSLDKSDKAPELILKLSELMRYILYESADDQVPMERQIDFIKNYIYLEKIRTNERLKVEFLVKGENTGMTIAPLMLIPFVENAFKHVAKKNGTDAFIRIELDISKDDRMLFRCENSKDISMPDNVKQEGIGLSNVKKRLEMQYPGKHTLLLQDNGDKYNVELLIMTL
jgi:sensor histidine kinase YesM